MPVTTTELMRFILELLANPTKAEAFAENPNSAMAVAGLSGVTCADVDALTPIIANAAPGAVAIVGGGGGTAGEMIHHIIKNVAVSNFANSGVIQNIWAAGDVRQAFAGDGGFAVGGPLITNDPIIVGDGNLVATDEAQAAGRDIIQNNGDGNMALGGDLTVAQDDAVVAGGDALAQGDKVGGNNNEAPNTGNDNSVHVGGNQNNAENTGNDNSITVGDISVDLSDNSDNSIDNSVGGDYWAEGSNVGGIGNDNSDNRNQGNTSDSGNTVVLNDDDSINVGTVAVDLSNNSTNAILTDNSIGGNQNNAENTGNAVGGNQNNATDTGNFTDESVTVGDVTLDVDVALDNSTTTVSGDTTTVDATWTDNSVQVGDVASGNTYDAGDTASYNQQSWSDDNSTYNEQSWGDYQSGNTTTTDSHNITGADVL